MLKSILLAVFYQAIMIQEYFLTAVILYLSLKTTGFTIATFTTDQYNLYVCFFRMIEGSVTEVL